MRSRPPFDHYPPRIGLTGGIGSGKTTVAHLFAGFGIMVLDADVIARELVEPGQPALSAIAQHFGSEILREGRLDRAALKERIFAHPAERNWLDALLHPLVYQQLEATMAEPVTPPTPYFLLVIPLLLETGRRDFVDRLWVVDVPESLQRQRVAARDGLDEAVIERILASQYSRAERLAQADAVIDNTGTPATLMMQVRTLHEELLAEIERSRTRP